MSLDIAPPAVELVHDLLRRTLLPGDAALDGTAGRGKDTLLLAELVGETGRVFAFDVQEEACRATEALLREQRLAGQVRVICDGHEKLPDHVQEPLRAAVFNLGYLPGGDHRCTTTAASTVAALSAALALLLPGGLLCVTAYVGHPGGREEYEAVADMLAALPPAEWRVIEFSYRNRTAAPVVLLAQKIERKTGETEGV